MATTIVSPGQGGAGGGFGFNPSAIDSAFSNIYNMFGGSLGPGNYNASTGGFGPGGVSPQPISGSDNSLTAFWRGLSNLAGTAAPSMLQAGGNLIGTGMGINQTGLDVTGAGLQTMGPAANFNAQLLAGNPQAMPAGLAPAAQVGAQNVAQIQNTAGQGIRGGQTAQTVANEPFTLAGQLQTGAEQLQAGAAQNLAGIGEAVAGIGQGVSQTGLQTGQLGTVLTGQGFQALQNTIADVLSKLGSIFQGGTAMLFSYIVGSL